MMEKRDDELCVCITPGCCHLHLYRFEEDKTNEYWWSEVSCHRMNWWQRLKLCWQILRGRDHDLNNQMFGDKEAQEIYAWLGRQLAQVQPTLGGADE